MSPDQTFAIWRSSLKSPDDSIFYYHPDLERILLGLSIFALSSRLLLRNLGKAEALGLLNIYIPGLITAWIDEDDETFETMFPLTMAIAEAYIQALVAMGHKYPTKRKQIKRLGDFYTYAISAGGDMTGELAETLLEDLSTDGKDIYSPKIKEFGENILCLLRQYGPEIPSTVLNRLNGRQLI